MIFIDKQTGQRVVTMPHTGDITYFSASKSSIINKEDIPVIGPWSDFTGSADPDSKLQQQFGGIVNELQGTDAQLRVGEKLNQLTARGNVKGTTRERKRLIYKKLD